ncbi:hypothetical protein K8M07_11500 [Schnuerera sp. xch1]|uniref:hypothetical protein n=1 Tax=Schnuerera sp. xch1 TaxID=2874283 RepID=UPI001CBF8B02|nr:hypothetical protein [Schnuerera sp. xch1]MBZ2175861.1 hypothetical protein [Schnuerera sp. xch1]
MIKYMKYEIKGTYKYILGILALVLILITGIYTYISRANRGSHIGTIFIGLSVLVLFGTALATFLYIVGSFRKELYDDRGYLTFTLPLTGNQIVGSKLIVALLWFAILGTAIAMYNIVMALILNPVEVNLSELLSMVSHIISMKEIVVIILGLIFNGVNMLVLIYFSMALSRVTFRNKRIGGLWFVIFLILSGVIAYGQYNVGELLPYYVDLNTFNIESMNTLRHQLNMGINTGIMMSTNIAASIYSIAITVILFIGTGYLIEKKIDL